MENMRRSCFFFLKKKYFHSKFSNNTSLNSIDFMHTYIFCLNFFLCLVNLQLTIDISSHTLVEYEAKISHTVEIHRWIKFAPKKSTNTHTHKIYNNKMIFVFRFQIKNHIKCFCSLLPPPQQLYRILFL